MKNLGFVIIGRNEGRRLGVSIDSVMRSGHAVVYVDSGSSDDSVALAGARGLPVVELDPAIPFTAARARNAGLHWHMRNDPQLVYVHFIDGDCELWPGWIDKALETLAADHRLAAVCGRRRERDPDASPYNQLCDHEWDTPVGLVETVGGDALFRVAALKAVKGFDETLIAGEEPELCHRIRRRGWLIRRIDADMTIHDAAMTRFAQWWQRNRRNGYAIAESLTMRGTDTAAIQREVVSNVIWGLPPMWPFWPLLWLRIWLRKDALQATWMTLGKVPHLQGQIDFWRRDRCGRGGRSGGSGKTRLIEYK